MSKMVTSGEFPWAGLGMSQYADRNAEEGDIIKDGDVYSQQQAKNPLVDEEKNGVIEDEIVDAAPMDGVFVVTGIEALELEMGRMWQMV